MKEYAYSFLIAALLACAPAGGSQDSSGVAFAPGKMPVTNSLDADCRFLKRDAPGAEAPAYDDSKWTPVSVPHDWSIEGPFDAKNTTVGFVGTLVASTMRRRYERCSDD